MFKAKEFFKELLHRAKLKATPSRLALLTGIEQAKKPLSIKKIQTLIKRYDIDQATIYRILNILVARGVVRRVDVGHEHAHYELVTTNHHHHLICENCNTITDIHCDTEKLERQALKAGNLVSINRHSLEFFGICKSCAKK